LAILNRLAEERASEVDIIVFGATTEELERANLRLHDRIINAGRLSPTHVSRVVRQGHFILDLSDYQAFGRSLAEAMACGLVPVSTKFGAPPEFIEHEQSGYLVTPADLDETYSTILEAIAISADTYADLSSAAVSAVSDWSTDGTAADWLALARDVGR
jgi:glycosyltransferase involved in cell wall biosynthesis